MAQYTYYLHICCNEHLSGTDTEVFKFAPCLYTPSLVCYTVGGGKKKKSSLTPNS